MALLNQPVEVTTRDGRRFSASALQVDFERALIFVRFREPFENTSGWIALERVRVLDDYDPGGFAEQMAAAT